MFRAPGFPDGRLQKRPSANIRGSDRQVFESARAAGSSVDWISNEIVEGQIRAGAFNSSCASGSRRHA